MARERVHRLRQSPGPGVPIYIISSHPISHSSHPIPQPSSSQLGVSQHRLMRPRHGSQNTTARKPSRCTALTPPWSYCSILSSSRGQNAKSLGPQQTPCLNLLDNTRAPSPVTVGLFNSIQFWFFFFYKRVSRIVLPCSFPSVSPASLIHRASQPSKREHLSDPVYPSKQHNQSIDANAPATGRRQPPL